MLETALTRLPRSSVTAGDLSTVTADSAEAAANAGSVKVDGCNSAENVEASDVTAAPSGKKAADAAAMLGELGDYALLEEIGRGGQGVVFRARQKSLNRTVALKVISLGQWASKAHLKRFRLEAKAAASLEHPGIVPIHEVGERGGSCYFSMQFIEGGQLDEVARREPMPIRRGAELIAKVARTVHYAHEHGILHRDIKPGNILLDAKGEPHLTDFGLARLLETESTVTRTLEVLGTPSYMAPEQAVGNNAAVSKATDVYGLGAVLYQLLTGQPPFAGGTTYETIKLVLDTEPRQPRLLNPKIDRDLSTICLKCLEKDPKRRYSSALALAEDLERWLRHEPIQARRTGIFARGKKWVRRNPILAGGAVFCFLLSGAVVWLLREHFAASPPAPPEKSVAILPFQNLSKDPENAFFTDGVQDEILTSLARVQDLKVISHTSVRQYKATGKRNLRAIGQQLGVAHVVEGSVQRVENRVRVNAQLINARNDAHLWAQTYDGDLTDVFAIQSQIAKTIAEQLQARISAGEKAAIAQAPTTDLVANALYQQALQLEFKPLEHQSMLEAVRLLEHAIERDPKFTLAYCAMSRMHTTLYFYGYDHTPARRDQANAALQKAALIQPNAGEVHLAAAEYWFHGFLEYDRARAELELARRSLPNNPKLYLMTAAMDRRQGRWSEAVHNFERAVELDPRHIESIMNTGFTYHGLRRYSDATRMYERAAALSPPDYFPRIAARSFQARYERADIRPLRAELNAILAENPKAITEIAEDLWECALIERDRAAAERALAAIPSEGLYVPGNFLRPREEFVGYAARLFGDAETARTALTTARAKLQKTVDEQPEYAVAWSYLGRVDAALGRKDEAIREGRHACELLPLSKDAWFGPMHVKRLAVIYAWTGEKELAITTLEQLLRLPGSGPPYGDLKLNPDWDPLRGEPRFEKLVASLAPK
jgi:TolB-like protein/Tfp pilus assembly protein PilF